jgi:hypothetical protein
VAGIALLAEARRGGIELTAPLARMVLTFDQPFSTIASQQRGGNHEVEGCRH